MRLKTSTSSSYLDPDFISIKAQGPDGNGEGEKGLGCIRLVALDSSSNCKSIFRLARFESFVKETGDFGYLVAISRSFHIFLQQFLTVPGRFRNS